MKSFFLLLAMIVSTHLLAGTKPVPYVDLNEYIGTWYEIASIPQSFARNCFCTRAEYSFKKNGDINVFNTCNKKSIDGRLSKANGKAKVENKETNSELKVSFFGPFYGDYWIIGLDKNYEYAVVSNREGSSLWILSRSPQLKMEELNKALSIAQSNGIDIGKLRYMEQMGCHYP
jgi:apolipoprotein D and lipocalin family protein